MNELSPDNLSERGIDWTLAKPIVVATVSGLFLDLLAIGLHALLCGGKAEGLCGAIWQSPPWAILALIALMPSLVVTWYWRMEQRRAEQMSKRAELRAVDEDLRLAEAEIRLAEREIEQHEQELRNQETELRIAEAEVGNNREHIKVLQMAQLPERFSRAVDLLGSEKIEARLGAIYALERLSRESARDHWIVVETLAAFVRQNAPLPLAKEGMQKRRIDRVPDDIQATLTVLGRRRRDTVEEERETLDLSSANLRRARLENADFERADLKRSVLVRAELEGARLVGANLSYAELSGDTRAGELEAATRFDPAWIGANLNRADLRGVRFLYADLRGAKLREALISTIPVGNADIGADFFEADLTWADANKADFRGASLVGAKLVNADLSYADCARANFTRANLHLCNLSRANLAEVNFSKADLSGAKLKTAVGLTAKQLEAAASYEGAELPEELQKSLAQRRPENPTT